MKSRNLHLFILFLILFNFINGQKTLQVLKVKLGSFKKYEIYNNDVLEYKLKGDLFYRKDRIVNMRDSIILFQNDSIIKLSQIKAIKFRNGNHLLGTLNAVCYVVGFGYVTLNVINNLILQGIVRADMKAVYVSGGFLAAGFIFKQLRIKRIRIKQHVTLKIIDPNFQNLGK